MSQLTDELQRQLAGDLVAAVERFAPDWTSHSSSDPGITVLELFAWLCDVFNFSMDRSSAPKTDLLKQLIAKLSSISPRTLSTSDLTRPRFFNGQLLTAADFQAEQDYSRKMMWLHNRCLFGTGIVKGLRVTLDSSSSTKDEPVITVAPGCAIAPDGQQLIVCEALRCVLRTRGPLGYVVIQYCERAINPGPTPSGAPECSRIEEGVAVVFEDAPIGPLGSGLAIARLKRKAGRWVLDPQFHAPKIGLRR
jgi:hypothetical protein